MINLLLHLDKTLVQAVATYGTLVYIFAFIIIFMETGFVVTPFLPGDSLIFTAAAIAATGSLNILVLYVIFMAAAILGDTVNYWIGHYIGPKVFEVDSKFIKKKYLLEAHKFYEKHGPKAITLARFVPIVRTFAPFIAGVAKMDYKQFISYNVLGGFLWVSLFTASGYFFGNLAFVKENFHYIVIAIIILSLTPMLFEVLKSSRQKHN